MVLGVLALDLGTWQDLSAGKSNVFCVADGIITLSCATSFTGVFYSGVGVGWGSVGGEHQRCDAQKRNHVFLDDSQPKDTFFFSLFS